MREACPLSWHTGRQLAALYCACTQMPAHELSFRLQVQAEHLGTDKIVELSVCRTKSMLSNSKGRLNKNDETQVIGLNYHDPTVETSSNFRKAL
jgi:hypothetical protein